MSTIKLFCIHNYITSWTLWRFKTWLTKTILTNRMMRTRIQITITVICNRRCRWQWPMAKMTLWTAVMCDDDCVYVCIDGGQDVIVFPQRRRWRHFWNFLTTKFVIQNDLQSLDYLFVYLSIFCDLILFMIIFQKKFLSSSRLWPYIRSLVINFVMPKFMMFYLYECLEI